MRKLLKEVEWLIPGHKATKCQSLDSNPSLSDCRGWNIKHYFVCISKMVPLVPFG